jgi:hypothetical protein
MVTFFKKTRTILLSQTYNKKHSELSRKDDTYYKDLIKEMSKVSSTELLTDKNITALNKKLATPTPKSA